MRGSYKNSNVRAMGLISCHKKLRTKWKKQELEEAIRIGSNRTTTDLDNILRTNGQRCQRRLNLTEEKGQKAIKQGPKGDKNKGSSKGKGDKDTKGKDGPKGKKGDAKSKGKR